MTVPRIGTALAALVAAALTAPALPAGAAESIAVTGLRADGMVRPLGIDDTTPHLNWQVTSSARGTTQTAYQVQVASSAARLAAGDADLWDSGKVAGTEQRREYAGTALGSRDRGWWRVRVWHQGAASAWSEPTWFEAGLTSQSDWEAGWVANEDWRLSHKAPKPVTVRFPETTARYVRVEVSKLGLPLSEQSLDAQNRIDWAGRRFPEVTYRAQLAEVQVRSSANPGTNFVSGRSKAVTAS